MDSIIFNTKFVTQNDSKWAVKKQLWTKKNQLLLQSLTVPFSTTWGAAEGDVRILNAERSALATTLQQQQQCYMSLTIPNPKDEMLQAVLSRPIQEVAVSIQMQNGSNFEYSSILMVLIGSIQVVQRCFGTPEEITTMYLCM